MKTGEAGFTSDYYQGLNKYSSPLIGSPCICNVKSHSGQPSGEGRVISIILMLGLFNGFNNVTVIF